MNQATWRLGLYSKVVLTVIAVSFVGLLVGQLPRRVEAQAENPRREEKLSEGKTRELVKEFMEKMPYDYSDEVLMSYISKEYFESRWLNPDDFEVNLYKYLSEFRILEVKLPYVDVEMIGGTEIKRTTRLRFKVIREQNSFVIFPSRAEKTAYGNWVDPWWAIKEEGITIGEIEPKKEVVPREPFLFENVTVWKISLFSGAALGTRLTGEVVNQSGVTYNSHAWFKVTLYNRAGEVLGWREFTTFEFRDGERKRFKVFFNDVDSSDVDWKIEFDRGS